VPIVEQKAQVKSCGALFFLFGIDPVPEKESRATNRVYSFFLKKAFRDCDILDTPNTFLFSWPPKVWRLTGCNSQQSNNLA
jgi:hypothetical protein